MCAGGVVLQLEVLLQIVRTAHLAAAAIKGLQHVDGSKSVVAVLGGRVVQELEASLIDGLGSQYGGFCDLHPMFSR